MKILFLCLFLIPVLIFVRNEWVFRKRRPLNRFENGIHIIDQYISYDQMMCKFWIWNIEKLRKPNGTI